MKILPQPEFPLVAESFGAPALLQLLIPMHQGGSESCHGAKQLQVSVSGKQEL